MNNWFYIDNKGCKIVFEKLEDFPKDTIAFVYIVTNKQTGQYYIGQKSLKHTTKRKLSPTQILQQYTGKGRKPKYKIIEKESDWKTYFGSNSILKEELEKVGKDKFERKILEFCPTKKIATYKEVWHQFNMKVLEDPLSYNSNILGTFYRKDLLPKEL
jgi:hypothetical protein